MGEREGEREEVVAVEGGYIMWEKNLLLVKRKNNVGINFLKCIQCLVHIIENSKKIKFLYIILNFLDEYKMEKGY